MANYNTVITNEGAALLASVIANHGTITFTDLKLSENDYTGQETTMTAGTFDGVFADVVVASSIVDITTIKVSATVHGYNISGDHNLYALGVIGTDGNTTALIAICTTTNPDVLRDNSSTYAFNINLTVSSTSNITVVGTTAAALYTTDIVDNLTSTATDKPLSANMGKKLADEKQDKTLATPITVDGTQETTVEGALGALNTYSDKIKDNLSNRNLVDNGWFTVNQRGATTITSGYGADRWQFVEGTSATYNSNGVSLDNSFICQIFENQLPNGQYTASVKYQNGTIEHGTAIKADDSTAITFFTSSMGFKLMYIPLAKRFDVNGKIGSTTSIRAVKLEVGSKSTLANDVAPNHAFELAKCRASTADPSDTYANKGDIVNYIEYNGSAADDKAFFTDVINHVISLYGGSGQNLQFIVGGLKQSSYYYKGIGYGYFGGGVNDYVSLQCSSYISVFLISAGGGVIQIRQIDGTLI